MSPPRAISDGIEPARFNYLGPSDKIALLLKMLEQLYPFSERMLL